MRNAFRSVEADRDTALETYLNQIIDPNFTADRLENGEVEKWS